jgi:hypothetical protein
LKRQFNPLYILPYAIADLLKGLTHLKKWLSISDTADHNTSIASQFFGINVAPSDNPDVHHYTLERLEELGLRRVRMDFTYNSVNGPAQQLLDSLLEQDYHVMLDIFPQLEDAEALYKSATAQTQWANFLRDIFECYQGKVECFEIGSTPNRGKWSGFSSRSMLGAWKIAIEVAESYDVMLAGPNVSDFEPIFNATYLSLLERFGRSPKIHTDNLFVERVMEPEAYDYRALGRFAAPYLKLNLIKKARILDRIGRDRGCEETWCTYTCWTKKRLARKAAWPEQKAADYLVRYIALAASSGALARVYWGPLICQRDGLISTQVTEYPDIDQVSFYQRARGELENFETTPVFYAFKHAIARLSGAHCTQAYHQPDGVSLFRYQKEQDGDFDLCWCRDGQAWALDEFYSEHDLAQATFYDSLGNLVARPVVITEHPLLIEIGTLPITRPEQRQIPVNKQKVIHLSSPDFQSTDYQGKEWLGAYMLRKNEQPSDLENAQLLRPECIVELKETAVLRDTRNRLWNINDPRARTGQITVKLNRATGFKRISYRFRPSKGRRHWNNACEILRRGVDTPLPVAFHERPEQSGIKDSWYLCEFMPDAFSARDVYAAFRDGNATFKGLDKTSWFSLLTKFICHMHDCQIVHRDLSSGNLLIHQLADGSIQPMLIDIGRAWLGNGSGLRERHRLQDLMRIAYKLNWQDRELFIALYGEHMGHSFSSFWRLPFQYYDSKQGLKKSLKKKYRKRSKN